MTIDWTLLWHMNGHGPYVWATYGVATLLLVVEAGALWHRRRTLRAEYRPEPEGRRP
ncbi:heme exporter protein CcmD [uncultured Aquabacterium sp.]|uniref:heme exporter protein CcmD n=1 Tax=uncultured Aquabacterium sp. TaxID=158753 RepID=UPI002624C17C|nr:heme exporter protein CcmD [uncultured Aquabacterium sp.]